MKRDRIEKMYDSLAREAAKKWQAPEFLSLPFNIRKFRMFDETSCAWTDWTRDLEGFATIVEFNSTWLPYIHTDEAEVVLRHELAHARAGFHASHGPTWQKLSVSFGSKPDEFLIIRRLADVPFKITRPEFIQNVMKTIPFAVG